MDKTKNNKTHILTQTAIISVLIIQLQFLSSLLVKFGFFSISLVLVPVVMGGILMGPKYGAFFGGVFGTVVTLFCIVGLDGGGFIIFNSSPLMCTLMCMIKGIAAGFIPALLYKILYNLSGQKKRILWIIISAALAPIFNTGIFCLFMFRFFRPVLFEWAGQTDIMTYVITSLVGINFIFEFVLNVVVCPSISTPLFKLRSILKINN